MKTFVKVWLGIALIAIGIGAALFIIAVASGASFRDIPTISYSESYTEAKSIDMEIEYGEVKVVDGDTFAIDAENLPENGLESYVNDEGTWIIKQTGDNDLNFWGMHFSVGNIFNWNGEYTPRITITVPKDYVADRISMLVEAGEVKADALRAVYGRFEVAAGRLSIQQLEVTEESDYIIGAGQMNLNQVNIADISVDCGVGDVSINGIVTGDSDISCNVGNVDLELEGEDKEYSYDISSSIGNVNIDNNSYHSISNRIINNEGAENSLKLKCEIGNISVDFN